MKRNKTHADTEIIKKHYATFDENDKIAIDRSADRIVKTVRSLSNGRAKIGEVSALEILYKLGRFVNENDIE